MEIGSKKEMARNVQVEALARRRKLSGLKKAAAVVTVAAIGYAGLSTAAEALKKPNLQPESYYTGQVEVIIDNQLNIRTEPVITGHNDEPNNVNWNQIETINGVKVKGDKGFIIDKPLITKGDNPQGPGGDSPWITFDARVDQLIGDPKSETLYISLGPATSSFVKPMGEGTLSKLESSPNDTFGKITVEK